MRYGSLIENDFARKAKHPGKSASPELRTSRLKIILAGSMCWVFLIVFQLYNLQIAEVDRWQESAFRQHFVDFKLSPERGPIYDRNNRLMAVSVPAGSVYVRPRQVKDKPLAALKIASVLNLDPASVEKKLSSPSPFVWIKRQTPKVHAEKVTALGLQGVGHVLESKRFYPYNQAASTLIGRVGVDGTGLSGLEAAYNKRLHSDYTSSTVGRDAFGSMIAVGLERGSIEAVPFALPRGNEVQLTLDAGIQLIMDEELERARRESNAKALMAAMIDADTGEILAMGQSPTANFNQKRSITDSDLRNLVTETVFEPGSILKTMVAAGAIEANLIKATDVIDCQNGRFAVGRHQIRDVYPQDKLTLRDIVIRSSNIGMSKVGFMMGKEKLHASLADFGFGELISLGLPGETRGILRSPDRWREIDIATHSFGQGVAVTPLQMVRAVSAIANGGVLPSVHIIAGQATGSRRVISRSTADIMKDVMVGVVKDERGTGKRAAIENVLIGGKTGTAQKADPNGRGYLKNSYIASFVGFADATDIGVNRRLSLIVVVDEPNTSSIYGGVLAAPVFKRIMERSLHTLQVQEGEFVRPQRPQPVEPGLTRVALVN